MSVPVLLIAFNRPDLAEFTLKRIIEANPSKIYFAVDGARIEKPGEEDKVKRVRNLVSLIPKFIPFEVRFSDSNHGCREGVSSAITWFFTNEESGIILEDDCFPDLSFFPFCEALLIKYKDDYQIGMISGNNFFRNKIHLEDSYFFSNYFHIWGWASWRRSWLGYQSSGLDSDVIKTVVKRNLKNKRARKFWIQWITESANGRVDTWDHQWTFHNWKHNRISIMPNVNLIANLGFRSDGTHTLDEDSQFANLESEPMIFPLVHPKKRSINKFYQKFVEVFFYPALLNHLSLKVKIAIYNLIKK
ncbi:hypothetical protein [Leptospira levettii]|uniref:Nucleotide-diphospho-sugar transferase n=1 Tax=Leptospira levettii TaxID=2023178 RepID=A0AAW5VBP0_9LEPT|nr:hypothetical protein [Leptospira levettii]MCW7466234.1 hypothetical protein [Leptospira levettii]MCW7512241.1 hypothetical protein [Leptospira levettii]MCW7516249.1 hypothetical protein [Leptospira levettii]